MFKLEASCQILTHEICGLLPLVQDEPLGYVDLLVQNELPEYVDLLVQNDLWNYGCIGSK
jgi:hypothetical protein